MSDQVIQHSKRGWTKTRAVLAGGLVLGVGAAITLAAWSDQEWAIGTFGSGGAFGIEGSVDGGAFSEHATEGAAAELNFQVNAENLAPGDNVYAGFAVQLITTSTNAANVTITQDESDAIAGTEAHYVYTTSAVCTEDAFGAGTNADGATFALAAVETPQYLCFKVTADDTMLPGVDGTIVWTFDAESGAAI